MYKEDIAKRRKAKEKVDNTKENIQIAVLCLAVVLIILFLVTLIKGFVQDVNTEVSYKNYTIQAGDTLYDIAASLDLNEDIRKTVYNIQKDNGIEDVGNIQIGSQIKLRK